ncbi:MAG: hypothetical protein MRY83_08455 [Flavobacteriales bacterium]|nr:hypothetical protein [Flavobacteriales bacterium]
MIYIENRKTSEKKLKEKYPNAHIVDVTSKAETGLVKLSPFYPHGGIPIPFSENKTAMCVEGIWQGLKVFEKKDIDIKMFENDTMKNIKRTVRKFGKPKGHRKGIKGKELLDYIEARIEIYLPAYLWVLENKVQYIINRLKEVSKEKDIVLLDYATNDNVLDPRKPLSHAFLVKAFVEGNYPTKESLANQTFEVKQLNIDFTALKNVWSSLPEKEISKKSGIRINTIKKISILFQDNENINFEKLSKTKGIGKATLQKLSEYSNSYKDQKNQPTLF